MDQVAKELGEELKSSRRATTCRWSSSSGRRPGDRDRGMADEVKVDAVVVGPPRRPATRLIGSVAVRLCGWGRWPVTVALP